jgi:hypothetical protein
MNLSKLFRTAIVLASLMLLSLATGAYADGDSFSLSGSAKIITGGSGLVCFLGGPDLELRRTIQ